ILRARFTVAETTTRKTAPDKSVGHSALIRKHGHFFFLRGFSAAPREMLDHPVLEVVHIEIDHGRGIQRQRLANNESADDGNAERAADLRADPSAECQ